MFSFLSFLHSRIAALPFVRLTLSDLTFASPMPKGKTREDLLFPNALKHDPHEADQETAVEHA
jgi:hypothetical protein